MTIICPNCKTELGDKYDSCWHCGLYLNQIKSELKTSLEEHIISNGYFDFYGGTKDHLILYADRMVVQHSGAANFILQGLKGDKTIYYSNITSVQFKKGGHTSGYIQFSLPGGNENSRGVLGAVADENTITLKREHNGRANEIVDFINNKIRMCHTQPSSENLFSPSAEIRKFKELLDDGIISQEEFDIKKKQLLGM